MDSALLARTGPAFSQWQSSLAVPARKLRLLGEEEKAALRERQKRLLAALGAGVALLAIYIAAPTWANPLF